MRLYLDGKKYLQKKKKEKNKQRIKYVGNKFNKNEEYIGQIKRIKKIQNEKPIFK